MISDNILAREDRQAKVTRLAATLYNRYMAMVEREGWQFVLLHLAGNDPDVYNKLLNIVDDEGHEFVLRMAANDAAEGMVEK